MSQILLHIVYVCSTCVHPIVMGYIIHSFFFFFKVDFANRESQLAFYHCMEKSGQDMRDFYEMLTERR